MSVDLLELFLSHPLKILVMIPSVVESHVAAPAEVDHKSVLIRLPPVGSMETVMYVCTSILPTQEAPVLVVFPHVRNSLSALVSTSRTFAGIFAASFARFISAVYFRSNRAFSTS